MASWFQFFLGWVRDPVRVGAIAPTTRYVAERVIRHIPSHAKTIVEYGPGNGAITIPLLEALPKGALLVAIERDASFANDLKRLRHPQLRVIHGDAREGTKYVKKPDVILSALPFSAFPDALKREILASTAANMKKTSKFIVYLQYTRVLERYLPRYFKSIKHDYEWRNLFPAHLFICSDPR